MTTLLLVRHGATEANLMRPYILQGLRPDSELAAEGVAQARHCGQSLRGLSIARIYTSPLKRAWRTALLIAEEVHARVVVEPGLSEIDTGLWSGLTWQEIDQRWPVEAQAFHDDAETHGYLGGENLGQLRQRVLPVVQRLVAQHAGETIVAVSHGVVNRVLLATWMGLPLRFARRLPQDNAAYNVITFEGQQAKVRTVNQLGQGRLAA